MNKADQRFALALAKLAEVFRVALTPILVEAYREALTDWPIESLEAGARALVRESKFFPRPVEWAEAAEDWLRERRSLELTKRIALEQSNEPPLTKQEDRKSVV